MCYADTETVSQVIKSTPLITLHMGQLFCKLGPLRPTVLPVGLKKDPVYNDSHNDFVIQLAPPAVISPHMEKSAHSTPVRSLVSRNKSGCLLSGCKVTYNVNIVHRLATAMQSVAFSVLPALHFLVIIHF